MGETLGFGLRRDKEKKAEVTEKEEKMRRNKVGSLFLVSVLALAGIGISYAGFSDSISVSGSVSTATLHVDVMTDWYSGTWVYKIWGFPAPPESRPPGNPTTYSLANEILVYHGFVNKEPTPTAVLAWAASYGGNAELEAYSYAYDNTPTTDIGATYYNLFPCIDFNTDFIFHYTGSIPGRINTATIFPVTGSNYPGDGINFLTWLWNYHADHPLFGAWVTAYFVTPIYGTDGVTITGWTQGAPVDVGQQLHNGNYVEVILTIHLPQDNNLQGLSGTFGGTISVQQWYDSPQV